MENSTFVVEFPSGQFITNFRATTINPRNSGGIIIQALDSGPKENSYWTDWGGNYDDLPPSPFLTLFIDRFLTRVENLDDLYALEYSSLVVGSQIYFHIPFYMWQLEEILSRMELLDGFSTNVPDPLKPSDDRIGGLRYPVRMEVPSLAVKLSDPVNGINLAPTFSVKLNNIDGFFDSQESSSILNNPITVRRSTKEPATEDTFKIIRTGTIENIKLDMDNIVLQGADILRSLDEPATRTCSEANISNSDNELPIVYGFAEKRSLIEIDRDENETTGDVTATYAFCDPDYYTGTVGVFNSDGDTVGYTVVSNGVISSSWNTNDETDGEPASISFNGITDSRLGWIIIKEVSEKTDVVYTDSFWNKAEAEAYANNSPSLSIYFESGSIKELIERVLKNDMAFFIQQNSGRMTLRKWGEKYTTHNIPSWMITKRPTRNFSDYKYFYSSVIIEYGSKKDNRDKYLNDSVEIDTVAKWKKKSRGTFETDLKYGTQAVNFSADLLSRFANRAQMWTVAVGVSTSEIELLDSVALPMIIADQDGASTRKLSEYTNWIAIGINPSQDVLQLEEDSYDPIGPVFDRTGTPLSHPTINYEGGYMSHIMIPGESGILSTNAVIGEV